MQISVWQKVRRGDLKFKMEGGKLLKLKTVVIIVFALDFEAHRLDDPVPFTTIHLISSNVKLHTPSA